MKTTAKCPKCQSEDILVFENSKEKPGKADGESLGVFGGKITTSRYVCCNCGYTERYFDDNNLEKLKKKYKKTRG